MPECNNFKKLSAHPVVDEIPYAWKVKPSNDLGTRGFHAGADTGFFSEQCQGNLDIQAHSARSGKSIYGPPLCCSFNLSLGARLDLDAERRSAEPAQPGKKLLGRNPFFSVGLVQGSEQLSFIFGVELYQRFIATREDSHGRSLRQRKAFNDDFAANYFT
jgi:hypothetical protein